MENNIIDKTNSVSKPISISFVDKRELYRSYMSFIQGGAIFIPTVDKIYQKIGLKVFVLMKIKDDKTGQLQTKPFTGTVVWINYSGNNIGVGVSLGNNETSKQIQDYIEMTIATIPNKQDIISYTI